MIRAGQRLHDTRIAKELTIQEIATATKIRAGFLTAIEDGDYNKLPSSTYAHGFVKNYAEFLGLPQREIVALFRREFDEEKTFKVLPEGLTKKEDFPLKRLRIQQTLLVITLLFFLLIGFLAYQYRYALISPPLEVISPKDKAVVSQNTTVLGKTDNNAVVTVNDKAVTVQANGKFSQIIALFPGTGKIVVQATNRFGKKTLIERSVIVKND